ncbi:MAG: hypothetical protein MI892_12735, partial [Desulfobacterales bacterium]|nr:hypothetical protein [Desulfobacterales bacterium]
MDNNNFWQDKKIIAYIALSHHTRFITPITEKLQNLGAKITYLVGQAERSQEITAIKLGLEYAHIFDYIDGTDNEDIQANYNRLKQTFARSLKNTFFLGNQPVSVTDKTLYATAMEYIGFKNLLTKEKPDICMALHEINRWGKMFAFWSKKNGIPLITMQEGLAYTPDFGSSGHAQYSTINLVWGDNAKKKFVSFEAPESKLIPVGNTHLAKEIAFQQKNKIREIKREEYGISGKFVVLLVLSALLPDPKLFKPIFKAVSDSNDLTVFVKFHPSCRKAHLDQWKKAILSQYKNNSYFIHSEENTYNLLSMADICVLGQQSTIGLEAVTFGKPLVKLDIAYRKNAPYSFVDKGVAIKMSVEELARRLLNQKDFSRLIPEKNKKHFLTTELSDMTQTIPKVCRIMEKIITANTTEINAIKEASQVYSKKWSIVIQVPRRPDMFLIQLEAVAVNSTNQGDYEVIILEPETKSDRLTEILDSLKGNVKRSVIPDGERGVSMINRAAQIAIGEYLIVLDKNLSPIKRWLDCLDKAFIKHGPAAILGARIMDSKRRITNAGVVVDYNNTPVSAYRYLHG